MKNHAAFGSWPSPITAQVVAGKSVKIQDARRYDGLTFWCESIASEKGRTAIMMHQDGQSQCVLPAPLSTKSKVHEYGGNSYLVHQGTVYFVSADDQRIYRAKYRADKFEPEPLTPEGAFRFADLCIDEVHQRLIAVSENHRGNHHSEVHNALMAIPLDGSQTLTTLAEGQDFYSNPSVSPDGKYVCWLSWQHPDMPWENTQLWLAKLSENGLQGSRHLLGHGDESLFQPQWSPLGDLYFVSDRDNWWNIFFIENSQLHSPDPTVTCVLPMQAEFATPQWSFGMSTYGFLDNTTLLAACTMEGTWRLAKISVNSAQIAWLDMASSVIESVHCDAGKGVFIGASPASGAQVFSIAHGGIEAVTPSVCPVNNNEISVPQAIEFPTSHNDRAYGLFYPPNNSRYQGPVDTKPPLIVICHGGPTGSTDSRLNLKVQYWTNRGFAVADVNYRGSTGYGRAFRRRLAEQWGIFDVDDVCAVVDYLGAKDLVNSQQCVIKGSSAGGYTALAALTFGDTFACGVSLYGISDLAMLAADTHKFEARYLDHLVGPLPKTKARYHQRSPIHAVDNINCPLLIFQGLQDKVVPPIQAEVIFQAVKDKGIEVAYVTYKDEAHGFRAADTIAHMLDAELQFYSALFDFPLPDAPQNPLTIYNT